MTHSLIKTFLSDIADVKGFYFSFYQTGVGSETLVMN